MSDDEKERENKGGGPSNDGMVNPKENSVTDNGVALLHRMARRVSSSLTWANPVTVVFLSIDSASFAEAECKEMLIASRDSNVLLKVLQKEEPLDDVLKVSKQVVAKFGPVCYVEPSDHLPELQALCRVPAASMDAICTMVKERAETLRISVPEILLRLGYIYEVIIRIALASLYNVGLDTTSIQDDQNPNNLLVNYFLVASKTSSFKNDEVLITKTPMKGNFGFFIESQSIDEIKGE